VNRLESQPALSRPARTYSGRPTHSPGFGPEKTSGDPQRGVQRPEGKPELPRLALTFAESAAMLGVSHEFFAQHVALELRFVRRGRKKLVALRELERWLQESASREPL